MFKFITILLSMVGVMVSTIEKDASDRRVYIKCPDKQSANCSYITYDDNIASNTTTLTIHNGCHLKVVNWKQFLIHFPRLITIKFVPKCRYCWLVDYKFPNITVQGRCLKRQLSRPVPVRVSSSVAVSSSTSISTIESSSRMKLITTNNTSSNLSWFFVPLFILMIFIALLIYMIWNYIRLMLVYY